MKIASSLLMGLLMVLVLPVGAVPVSSPLSAPAMANSINSPSLQTITVFAAGKERYPAVRIPSIVATRKGTLLAFAEGRENLGDQAENNIILKRSTDGGKTWLPLQTIADDGKRPLNNPCAVVEQKSGRIFLMFQSYPEGIKEASGKMLTGVTGSDIVRSYIIHSDDDGQNWSAITDITAQVKRPVGVTTIASGPGIGIQLQKGPHAGRLVIPFNEGPYGKWNIYVAYSDDSGASWRYGDIVPNASGLVNECQVAELSDGRLLFNSRRGGGKAFRKKSISSDGGQTWTPLEDETALTDPTCMASLLRLNIPERSLLLFAGAKGPGRTNGTVYISTDDGQTWPLSKTLFPCAYAYSSLVALPDSTLGCLYETDDYASIKFARFSLKDITQP